MGGGGTKGGGSELSFERDYPLDMESELEKFTCPWWRSHQCFFSLSLSLSMNSWCAPVLAFIGSQDFQSVVEYSYWRLRVCLHVQSCQSYFFAFQLFRNCSFFLHFSTFRSYGLYG